MTYPFARVWTLIRRTKSGVDAYGDDVFTETRLPVAVVYAPGGSTETLAGGDTVVTQPTLYGLPDSLTVSAADVFEDPAGARWEVDGDPEAGLLSPFSGWSPGTVVHLRKVT